MESEDEILIKIKESENKITMLEVNSKKALDVYTRMQNIVAENKEALLQKNNLLVKWNSILSEKDFEFKLAIEKSCFIDSNDYNYNLNWYHILTSLKGMPKNYIRRRNYDIPKIFKYNGEKSFRTKFREGSNQTFSFRTIQNGWCNFFCETK